MCGAANRFAAPQAPYRKPRLMSSARACCSSKTGNRRQRHVRHALPPPGPRAARVLAQAPCPRRTQPSIPGVLPGPVRLAPAALSSLFLTDRFPLATRRVPHPPPGPAPRSRVGATSAARRASPPRQWGHQRPSTPPTPTRTRTCPGPQPTLWTTTRSDRARPDFKPPTRRWRLHLIGLSLRPTLGRKELPPPLSVDASVRAGDWAHAREGREPGIGHRARRTFASLSRGKHGRRRHRVRQSSLSGGWLRQGACYQSCSLRIPTTSPTTTYAVLRACSYSSSPG